MGKRPRLRALGWLAFLAPFFYLTYNFANRAASRRAYVPPLIFPWERRIPFVGWTILPYWSSNLLYALSLATCRNREELDRHARRLIAIQVFSVACFLAFPLRCTSRPPAVTGWAGALFAALRSFDQPYNQAPSLHVGIAWILWTRFRAHTSGRIRMWLAAWFVLMSASTLTTWQHHFIDVPTGLWAGLLVAAALPERRTARPRVRLTLLYLAGAVLCTAVAFVLRGFAWLLLWPGFALSMVASAYWTCDPAWLGKPGTPAKLFLLPYTLAAWINSRLWTCGQPASNLLADSVWIGRAPSRLDRRGMNSVVTLAPELPIRADANIPMLDLVPPSHEELDAAVLAIAKLAARRPTLVCCALGYTRSAVASAAWLMAAGRAASIEDALRQVRRARTQAVVGPDFIRCLEQWAEHRQRIAG
ncbi:MAG TPA: phosphatase PAP2/dual specificity phosphatase family protein [Bryobacteraceae bacterium]|jgi:hypothetical protein